MPIPSRVGDGDRTSVTPPAGENPSMQVVDARGRVVERRQFLTASLTGAYDATTYAYQRDGKLTRVTDPVGNHWDYTYNLLGDRTRTADPDKGVTQDSYDNAGQLQTTTDSRGRVLAYSYDALGRKTAVYDTSTSGTKLADWTYDTLVHGQLTSSNRYDSGQTYTGAVTGYDDDYHALGTSVTLPATEGSLAGTWTTTMTYNPDGSLANTSYPAVGGLAAETVTNTYTDAGMESPLMDRVSATLV